MILHCTKMALYILQWHYDSWCHMQWTTVSDIDASPVNSPWCHQAPHDLSQSSHDHALYSLPSQAAQRSPSAWMTWSCLHYTAIYHKKYTSVIHLNHTLTKDMTLAHFSLLLKFNKWQLVLWNGNTRMHDTRLKFLVQDSGNSSWAENLGRVPWDLGLFL